MLEAWTVSDDRNVTCINRQVDWEKGCGKHSQHLALMQMGFEI
jgi:hypothetical protein